jgi:KipI family sensor histidine kinase inhibitor
MSGTDSAALRRAEIVPLGDSALLVRFGLRLDDAANRAALAFAARLTNEPVSGVVEVVPSLVSVLVRYAPDKVGPMRLAGELGLLMQSGDRVEAPKTYDIATRFDGPDLAEAAAALGLHPDAFVAQHNRAPLRVLTTGFAPGFVYCGLHDEALVVPRRVNVRQQVPAGSIIFAAGQTAIVATDVPTGWHLIGHTDFRNFRPDQDPPTLLRAGDFVRFVVAR